MKARNSLFVVFCLFVATDAAAEASSRSPAPQPGCLDARIVETVYVLDETRLAVASSDGRRHRVELSSACTAALQPEAELGLLAREGWVCGTGNEFVQVQGSQGMCAIASVAPVDAREFAGLARESSAPLLASIEVKGRRGSAFKGSEDFCFAAGRVRSWAQKDQGLVVDVAAPRSRQVRRYRVELDGACVELGRFEDIGFVSGANNGLVCGNTGDVVSMIGDSGRAAAGIAGMGASRLGSTCAIREVYPL